MGLGGLIGWLVGEGAGVNDFFYYESKFKIKKKIKKKLFFFWGWGEREGEE